MRLVLVIGIGPGDPEQLTVQAIKALNRADALFLLDKGAEKQGLARVRREIIGRYVEGSPRIVERPVPERGRDGEYLAEVAELNARKAALYGELVAGLGEGECGAFLVWGDPSLYDSTIAILDAVRAGGLAFGMEVVPGISSIQALAARHRTTLTRVGEATVVTTGRRLAAGFPEGAETAVVMLDAEAAYRGLGGEMEIAWGAYVGMGEEVLIKGRVAEVGEAIGQARRQARAANGWIMDAYLLRRL